MWLRRHALRLVVLGAIVAILVLIFDRGRRAVAELTAFEQEAPIVTTVAIEEHGSWRIDMSRPARCGVQCPLELTQVPTTGWHANRHFPYKLTIGDITIRDVEFDDAGIARFRVASAPNPVSAVLRVSACDEEICRVVRHEIHARVD